MLFLTQTTRSTPPPGKWRRPSLGASARPRWPGRKSNAQRGCARCPMTDGMAPTCLPPHPKQQYGTFRTATWAVLQPQTARFASPKGPYRNPLQTSALAQTAMAAFIFWKNERQTAASPLRQNEPVAPQVGRRAWRRRSGLRRGTAADKMPARARKRLGSMMAAIKQAQGGQKGDLGLTRITLLRPKRFRAIAPQLGRRARRRRSGLRRGTAADKMQARAQKRLGSMMAVIKQAQGGQKGDLG